MVPECTALCAVKWFTGFDHSVDQPGNLMRNSDNGTFGSSPFFEHLKPLPERVALAQADAVGNFGQRNSGPLVALRS